MVAVDTTPPEDGLEAEGPIYTGDSPGQMAKAAAFKLA